MRNSKNTKITINLETIFIQALPNSPALTNIVESLSKQVDTIIKEELNLKQSNEFKFFLPKTIQKLTLYSLNNLNNDNTNIITSSLEHIPINKFVANDISIKPEVEFFGGQFGENDELVVIINDPNEELSLYNQLIKTAMHKANSEYQKTHGNNLYDVTKSEHYSYVPHIGLGRVRTSSIKSQMKDPSQFGIVFERIQSRIKNIALDSIKNELNTHNEKLIFDKIGIFNPGKQSWIKEYNIKG